jgi:hypothetical protein
MLKLTYTETGLHLERLSISLEEFVMNRVLLCLRSGLPIHVETSRAAFLLTADAAELPLLKSAMRHHHSDTISVDRVDGKYVEVCFSGTWIASDLCSEEGTLVSSLSDRTEFYLFKLWQLSESTLTLTT